MVHALLLPICNVVIYYQKCGVQVQLHTYLPTYGYYYNVCQIGCFTTQQSLYPCHRNDLSVRVGLQLKDFKHKYNFYKHTLILTLQLSGRVLAGNPGFVSCFGQIVFINGGIVDPKNTWDYFRDFFIYLEWFSELNSQVKLPL